MAAVNIKITDLNIVQPNQIAESDMFLRSVKAGNVSAQSAQYISKTVELSSICNCLFQKERTVTHRWNFVNTTKSPMNVTRYSPVNFFDEYILKEARRNTLSVSNGTYANNLTFFTPSYSQSRELNAYNLDQSSVINLDYVNKITGECHNKLLEMFKFLLKIRFEAGGHYIPSFPGMLVFTTKSYNTNSIANLYGNGQTVEIKISDTYKITVKLPKTSWIQHGATGGSVNADTQHINEDTYYIFRTANTAKVKSTKLDVGSNKVLKLPLLLHSHTFGTHRHGGSGNGASSGTTVVNGIKSPGGGHHGSPGGRSHPGYASGETKGTIEASGSTTQKMGVQKAAAKGNTAWKQTGFSAIKSTKFVYVWERIS